MDLPERPIEIESQTLIATSHVHLFALEIIFLREKYFKNKQAQIKPGAL